MAAETIEQFVTNLETKFDQDAKIDINFNNLYYIRYQQGNTLVQGICDSLYVIKEQDWDSLVVERGESKVSEIVSTLKTFLPKYKDNLIVMKNPDNYFSLVSTNSLKIVVVLDNSERGVHILKHPRIIKHNQACVLKQMYKDLNTKINAFLTSKHETDTRAILKIVRSMLVYQTVMTPELDLPPPYFYLNMLYHNHEDVLTDKPDAKDVKFSLYKGMMISDSTLTELEKSKTIIDNKLYWIDSSVFSMFELLDKYTLTETQLIKFFVEVDIDSTDSTTSTSNKKLVCSQPDILKSFEK